MPQFKNVHRINILIGEPVVVNVSQNVAQRDSIKIRIHANVDGGIMTHVKESQIVDSNRLGSNTPTLDSPFRTIGNPSNPIPPIENPSNPIPPIGNPSNPIPPTPTTILPINPDDGFGSFP